MVSLACFCQQYCVGFVQILTRMLPFNSLRSATPAISTCDDVTLVVVCSSVVLAVHVCPCVSTPGYVLVRCSCAQACITGLASV